MGRGSFAHTPENQSTMAATTDTSSLVKPPIYTLPIKCVQRIANQLSLHDAKSLRLATRTLEQQTFNTFAQRYLSKLLVGSQGHSISAALEHLRSKPMRTAVRTLQVHTQPEPRVGQALSLDNAARPKVASVIECLPGLAVLDATGAGVALAPLDELTKGILTSQPKITTLNITGHLLDLAKLNEFITAVAPTLKSVSLHSLHLQEYDWDDQLPNALDQQLEHVSLRNLYRYVGSGNYIPARFYVCPGDRYVMEPVVRKALRDPTTGKIQQYHVSPSEIIAHGGLAVKQALAKVKELKVEIGGNA